jgi:uncharacterized protein YeaO (DUF488 family)
MSLSPFIKTRGPASGVNVDCYFAKLTKFNREFDNVHFEFIVRYLPRWLSLENLKEENATNTFRVCQALSPGPQLLQAAKTGGVNFRQYSEQLEHQLFHDSIAVKRMHELHEIAKSKVVFLICYESNPEQCHRSLVQKWINNINEYWKKWQQIGAAIF